MRLATPAVAETPEAYGDESIILAGATLQTLWEGGVLTEGPAPDGSAVYFSDITFGFATGGRAGTHHALRSGNRRYNRVSIAERHDQWHAVRLRRPTSGAHGHEDGQDRVDGNFKGFQVGFSNYVKGDFKGWQTGAINSVEGRFSGRQSGWYNNANDFHGLQIGLWNSAQDLDGLQIGLINLIRSGKPRGFLPIVNWSF